MTRRGSFVASGLSFGAAILLSQFRFGEERRFPAEFGEVASGEHGHEVAADRVEGFFEGRELVGRVSWLLFALGALFLFRGSLRPSK